MKNMIPLIYTSVWIFLISCEKNDDGFNTDRIVSYTVEYVDGSDSDVKYGFTYDGNNLIEVTRDFKVDGEWTFYSKIGITYEGENAIKTWYEVIDGNLVANEKAEYIFANGIEQKVTYYTYFENVWKKLSEWQYVYNEGDLLSYQYFNDRRLSGDMVLRGEGDFLYENGRLLEYKYTRIDPRSGQKPVYKIQLIYNDEKISGWIDYISYTDDEWLPDTRCDYTYHDNMVTRLTYFDWSFNSESWWEYKDIIFIYDLNGNLIKATDSYGKVFSYIYEKGKGNTRSFWYPPENLVYGDPAIKGASENINWTDKNLLMYLR